MAQAAINQGPERQVRAAAAHGTDVRQAGQQGQLAEAIDQSPPMALQRAVDQGIQSSPLLTAQRRLFAQLNSPGQPSAAAQKMPADGKEVPESQEEDLENNAPEAEVEAAAQGEGSGEQQGEQEGEPDEIGEEEEAETAEPVAQAKVAQLGKVKRSKRIATYAQQTARRDRKRRLGRHVEVDRFVPGAAVRTFRMGGIAALGGGTGLICPRGSYVRRRYNFNYTGSRAGDAAALGGTPPGHVWHHFHDFVSTGANTGHGTMILLRIANHLPGHRGGVWQWNNTPANPLAYG
jgi:hypothetical protein